ncbi:Ring finger domain [Phytophthora infestans]|uniref:Ring finger domain n=1 Tax=Phytophthora infestans TaxID=4787 RepID=A0A833WHP8_PHYIN|nr:Ring finger domain [Phytophthora infestans]
MGGITLSIPFTDRFEQGLQGIVEVQASDLLENASVSSLIGVLNAKFRAASDEKGSARIVDNMLLYGAELDHSRELDAVIPDLTSSSARLVARTRFIPRFVDVTVKTLTGKCMFLSVPVNDTVGELKKQIYDREGIPPDQQRLVLDGRALEKRNTLEHYDVKAECTLHLTLRMRGGGGPIDFADLDYEDTWLVELQLDAKAPGWRTCTEGINIEGECKNRRCKAFGEMVIHQNGYEAFNLSTDTDVKCPICKKPFPPITCGFYNCAWKFDGKRSRDDFSISSTWRNARGEKYYRFDTDQAEATVKWDSLLIVAKSKRDAIAVQMPGFSRSAVVRKSNVCSICWAPFGLRRDQCLRTGDCGHTFHRGCIRVWSEYCKGNDTLSTCPLCQQKT